LINLLKRKRKLPNEEEQEICNVCSCLLIRKNVIIYGKVYWCPKCKDWRYPEIYGRNKKKKRRLEPELKATDTKGMKWKMILYEEKLLMESKGTWKVEYKAGEHDQEFLASLIPKK